jgi:AbrB family looped-hinge helix DNA binding protein
MSTKGQIVIPLEIRRRMGVKPGDDLVIIVGDGEVTLMTAKRYAESLRGTAQGIYGRTREEIDAYVREERRTWPR